MRLGTTIHALLANWGELTRGEIKNKLPNEDPDDVDIALEWMVSTDRLYLDGGYYGTPTKDEDE
jgi:hypothetical protein